MVTKRNLQVYVESRRFNFVFVLDHPSLTKRPGTDSKILQKKKSCKGQGGIGREFCL